MDCAGGCDLIGCCGADPGRDLLLKSLVRTEQVVVTEVVGKELAHVALAEDQEMIEAFPSRRPNYSFDKCIGSRRPIGRPQNLDAEAVFQIL